MNKLFYGDNLDVMRKFIRDLGGLIFVISIHRSIPNLGYNQIYNNIGTEDRAQAPLVTDTWTWDDHANQCYEEILSNKNAVQTQQSIALINGLEKVLGKGSLFAGSRYLHCDPTASHFFEIVTPQSRSYSP